MTLGLMPQAFPTVTMISAARTLVFLGMAAQ